MTKFSTKGRVRLSNYGKARTYWHFLWWIEERRSGNHWKVYNVS